MFIINEMKNKLRYSKIFIDFDTNVIKNRINALKRVLPRE
jgi:hypothetical protein